MVDPLIPADRLQRLVDSLAERLSMAVLVDDPKLRPMAYSAQAIESVDRVRAASILNREAPTEVVDFLLDQGIDRADDPVRIAPNQELGLSGRVCSRVAEDGKVLGYLWVIENGRRVGNEETDLIRQVAEGAAPLLRTDARQRRRQVEARIDELLDQDLGLSCEAAADLLDAGEFSTSASASVLVAKVIPPVGETVDETVAVLLNRGIAAFSRGFRRERLLSLCRGDEAILVVGSEEDDLTGRRLKTLGISLRDHVASAAPDNGWKISVGTGSVVRSLAGASRSYGQAAQAAAVAGRLDDVDQVLAWSDMGIYRLLAPAAGGFDPDALPPGITSLLEHSGGEMLLHTLETYLDHGGDAQATTAELFLARGSLYYRLHRIEEIAGVNLRSGHDRLALHIGLKLARICGRYPTGETPPVPAADAPALAETA